MGRRMMQDKGFLGVAGLIALAIAADLVLYDAKASLFLVHKLLDLVAYLSFWR